MKWLPVRHHPDGCRILDVLVVGACQSESQIAYAFKREQVDNVAVIDPGAAPFLKDIHFFGIGACVSYGISGAPINATYVAVSKLVAGVTRGFAAKLEHHWEGLQAYDTSQVKLRN